MPSRRGIYLAAGIPFLALFGLAALLRNPSDGPPPVTREETQEARNKPVWQPWPPAPIVIGRPQSEKAAPPLTEPGLPAGDALRKSLAARPSAPDPSQPSPLNLVAVENLKALPAEKAVPALVAFLEAPAPAGGAYTKPTAVRALVELNHPLAEAALAKLAKTSTDERVRLTIAALWRRTEPQ